MSQSLPNEKHLSSNTVPQKPVDLDQLFHCLTSSNSRFQSSSEETFKGHLLLQWLHDNAFIEDAKEVEALAQQLLDKLMIVLAKGDESQGTKFDPSMQYSFASENISSQRTQTVKRLGNTIAPDDLKAVLVALKDEQNGVEVSTHKHHLRTYENTFSGSDLVSWVLLQLPFRTREQAVSFSSSLLDMKYIECAQAKVNSFKDDKDRFYTFSSKDDYPDFQPSAHPSLEDFNILEKIGRGAFGKVMKVEKKATKKVYAMKVMKKKHVVKKMQVDSLITERNVLLNDHPFLVTLHFSFQTQTKVYLVMDYISGGSLLDHIRAKHWFGEKCVRFFSAELALAIHHLHECGIVYRDLKAENVMVDKERHIALTDFGVCKELVNDRTTEVVGTPSHLAPEVLQRKGYGKEVDWWGLGVLSYELMTGRNPFTGGSMKQTFDNILHREVAYPESIFCSRLRSLLQGLLNKDAESRLGFEELKQHPFYKKMNWDKLMKKQVKSPFKPTKHSSHSPSSSDDSSSTSITATSSATSSTLVDLQGFTYVDPVVLQE